MINIFISDFFTFLLLNYFGSIFFKIRTTKTKHFIIFLIHLFIMICVNIHGTSSLKAILLFFIYTSYIISTFETKMLKKILSSISFFIIISTSEIITGIIMNNFINVSNAKNIYSFEFTLCLYISLLLAYFIIFIYKKCLLYFNLSNLPKITWLMLLHPIIIIYAITSINDYLYTIKNNLTVLLSLYSIVITNIIAIMFYLFAISSLNTKKDIEISKYKEKMLTERYELLNYHYKNNFNFLHDLLHECIIIKRLLENNNYSTLQQEINNLTETTYTKFNAIYSDSITLNTVINNRIETILDNSISISSSIKGRDIEFISFNDQIEMFSILLNFAIENNINNKNNKMIIFRSKRIGQQIIIQMTYSSFLFKPSNETIILNKLTILLRNYSVDINIYNMSSIPDIKDIIIKFN